MPGGASATSHPLATSAAIGAYAHGGNAIDAAIAAAFVLFVVEPDMSQLGGQAHILVRAAGGEGYQHIDAYSFAPAAAHARMYAWEPAPSHGHYRYRTLGDRNTTGAASVAVPATLLGLERLHGLGARLPWADLLRAAVEVAQHGFTIGEPLAQSLAAEWSRLGHDPEFRHVYGDGDGPKRAGTTLVQSDLAGTLRLIAAEGSSALHRGSLATAVIEAMSASEGLLTARDLASAPGRIACGPSLSGSYRGYEVHTAGPSSAGGMLLHAMLEEHERALRGEAVDSFALRLRAMQHAFERRLSYLEVAAPASARSQPGDGGDPPAGRENNTTHHSHLDEQGCAVALTQSIGDPFGSGVIPKGTGLLLNNAMKLFDPRPDRPGSIYGGRKGASTMTPTIVALHGAPVLALGSPSGTRIVSAVFQALADLLVRGVRLKDAVDAPRMHWDGDGLDVEADHPDLPEAEARGLTVTRYPRLDPWFGGVQAVGCEGLHLDGPLEAVADPRRPSFGGAASALPVQIAATGRAGVPGETRGGRQP